MNTSLIPSSRRPKFTSVTDSESGAVFVELALILPWLILFAVYATDYALERLAEAQVQAATIAATEYAQVKNCSIAGIKAAAINSVKASSLRYVNINESGISSLVQCEGVNTGTKGLDTCTSLSASNCNQTCLGQSLESVAPYVMITVSGQYTPLFPSYWFKSGPLTISNNAVVRTTYVSDCEAAP